MRKLFLTTYFLLTSMFFVYPANIFAQNAVINNPVGGIVNDYTTENTSTTYASGLLRAFFTILIVFASIYFFFNFVSGGIEWIGSGGDKAKLVNARSRVVNAVIGIIIVFSVGLIAGFISTVFDINLLGFNFNQLKVIQ